MFSPATKESAKITKDFAVNDVKSAANDANRSIDSSVNQVVDNLADYANQTGRKVRHFIDEAGNEWTHVSDRVSSEIRTNPLRSGLIALGVGFVLGAIARR